MIRNARHQDIPVLLAMLHEMHAASKYAGRVEISDKAAENLLESAIAMSGQRGPQGTHIVIAEQDGAPVGFMVGSLDRVYHIGSKLTANDVFLYVRPGSGVRPVLALIDSYIAWASAIRAVVEIVLSWSDTMTGAAAIAPLYERKGFVKNGESFEMRLDTEERRIAA